MDSITSKDLAQAVILAYEHLYDMGYLRRHCLVSVAGRGEARHEDDAWRLHRALIAAIETLNPRAAASAGSLPWRRYRLLKQHYVDGESPQNVADSLGISRRHFYRERKMALESLVEVWQDRIADKGDVSLHDEQAAEEQHLSLLRQEADRAAVQAENLALAPVVYRASNLSSSLLEKSECCVRVELPDDLPMVHGDEQILLHLLLGIIEHCVRELDTPELTITFRMAPASDELVLTVASEGSMQEARQLGALRELASSQGMALSWAERGALRIELAMPASPSATLLVVDDNPDIHQLFSRYLSGRGYRVVSANNASEGLDLAKQLKPRIVTVDLMMPDQDGLTLVSQLRNSVETMDSSIIVCSVLFERDLAMSLGADAFLAKPVSRDVLISTLAKVLRIKSGQ